MRVSAATAGLPGQEVSRWQARPRSMRLRIPRSDLRSFCPPPCCAQDGIIRRHLAEWMKQPKFREMRDDVRWGRCTGRRQPRWGATQRPTGGSAAWLAVVIECSMMDPTRQPDGSPQLKSAPAAAPPGRRDMNQATSQDVFVGPYLDDPEVRTKFSKSYYAMTDGFLVRRRGAGGEAWVDVGEHAGGGCVGCAGCRWGVGARGLRLGQQWAQGRQGGVLEVGLPSCGLELPNCPVPPASMLNSNSRLRTHPCRPSPSACPALPCGRRARAACTSSRCSR